MDIRVFDFSKNALFLAHFLFDSFQQSKSFEVKVFLQSSSFISFYFILNARWVLFGETLLNFLLFFLVVLPLDVVQQVLLPSFEHWILERVFLILLTSFVKIIHVQLDRIDVTCLTKEV